MLFKGITRLSELDIDADKDWNARGITNIRQLAPLMSKGDLLQRGDLVIQRIPAGPDGYVITSQGPGKLVTWAPAGGALKYYFPVTVDLAFAINTILGPDHTHNENAPLAREYRSATGDAPASYISRILSTISSVDAQNIIAAPDHSHNANAPIGSGLEILVDGFVEETSVGAQTDHTAEARSGAGADINLCPFTTVGDKIYIGCQFPFWQAWVNVSTTGAGNWTNSAYYWNGAWQACVGEEGDTDFQGGTGWRRIQHTPQGDWALSVIMAMNLYWMKIECTNWVNEVTPPIGSQIFVAIA